MKDSNQQKHSLLTAYLFLLAIFALTGCSGSYEPTDRHKLESEFNVEFGFNPPSQVGELHCKEVVVGDTWGKWMTFSYDQSTVQRILTEDFTNAPPDAVSNPWSEKWSQDLTGQNPNSPLWWKSPTNHAARIYFKTGDRRDYAGFTYLWIDDTSKTVYVKVAAWH